MLVTKQEQVEEVLEAKEIYQLLTMVGRRISRPPQVVMSTQLELLTM